MKICVLTHTFPRNDQDVAAAFMKPFADGLVQSGNKVTVVTPFDSQFKRQDDPFEITTYKYIWPNSLHLLGYSKAMEGDVNLRKRNYMLLPLMLLFGTLALWNVVKREKPDLVNVHWILPNGLMAIIVFWLTRTPFVVTIPGTDAYLASRNKLFGWVSKFIAQSSAGITSNSSLNLSRIINLGVTGKPTLVLAYPADVSFFKPLNTGLDKYRTKLKLVKSNFVILAVGRFVYKKGFDYLLKAVARVSKKYPQVRLVIGGDGDLREVWETIAAKLQIHKIVEFVGNINRDEIIYYYNLSDVFVAPSIIDEKGNVDGGPVVTLESMACGKPQILTNVLGMADVIEDGVNGYIVPEKNAKALAQAIEKLIRDPELRSKMGRENRSLAQSVLSTKRVGRQYTNFFKRVISE